MHTLRSGLLPLFLAVMAALLVSGPVMAAKPLRVILIPADGGTEDGTRADYTPLFNAISRQTGLTFDIRVGQSYGAVVEAMCNGSADIAFVGAVTFVQAHQRKCAELLAVAVEKGQSSYYAGLFTRSASPIKTVPQIRGRRVAFGDINSASSFVFPVSMIMDAGIDPVKDLSALRLTGSHASSLAALTQNQVDVAALSFDSFDKAIRQGAVDPKSIRVIAKSIAIPYPPIVMNTRLPTALKVKLKSAFETVHTAPGVTQDMIRGYGGAKVDRYDTKFSAAKFSVAARTMARIDDRLKGEILKKASAR